MSFAENIKSDIEKLFGNTQEAGTELTLINRSKSVSDAYGDESFTQTDSTTIYGFFEKIDTNWIFDKEGEIKGGDAFLLAQSDVNIQKNDLIKRTDDEGNTEVYVVKNVKPIIVANQIVAKKVNLFYGEDE